MGRGRAYLHFVLVRLACLCRKSVFAETLQEERGRRTSFLRINAEHWRPVERSDDVVVPLPRRSHHVQLDQLLLEPPPTRRTPYDKVVMRREDTEHVVEMRAHEELGAEGWFLPSL